MFGLNTVILSYNFSNIETFCMPGCKSYTGYGCGFLFCCMAVGRASSWVEALAWNLHWWVGAWCVSKAGITVTQLKISLAVVVVHCMSM